MDRTVAITGATRGIGRAVAEAFVDAGAFVAICGRDGAVVSRTVAEVNGNVVGEPKAGSNEGESRVESDGEETGIRADNRRGHAWGSRADVRDEFDLERFFERVARETGSIDVVIANAGVFHGTAGERSLGEESYSGFDDTLRTNARGVFATVKEALPHLSREARVLVPSGVVAHESTPGMGAYAVSKAAAEAVARGFAADVDATVGVVDPGLVATDLTNMDRARDPDSVAQLFVWAAIDAPADEIDGNRVGLREWKRATR